MKMVRKIISTIIDILICLILILAIQTLAFSTIMYVLKFFGDEITIGVSINLLCFSIAASLAQVWVFFYFLVDVNILKYREKKQ